MDSRYAEIARERRIEALRSKISRRPERRASSKADVLPHVTEEQVFRLFQNYRSRALTPAPR